MIKAYYFYVKVVVFAAADWGGEADSPPQSKISDLRFCHPILLKIGGWVYGSSYVPKMVLTVDFYCVVVENGGFSLWQGNYCGETKCAK